MSNLIEFVGKVSSFGARVVVDGLRIPFEGSQILTHIAEVGYKSLPLVAPAGFALGTVMTFHTRSTLVALDEMATRQRAADEKRKAEAERALWKAGRRS